MIHFIAGPLHGEVHPLSRWNPLPPSIYARMPREFSVADLYRTDLPAVMEPLPIIEYRLTEVWTHDRRPLCIMATTLDFDRAIRIFNGDEYWRPPREITAEVRSRLILTGISDVTRT